MSAMPHPATLAFAAMLNAAAGAPTQPAAQARAIAALEWDLAGQGAPLLQVAIDTLAPPIQQRAETGNARADERAKATGESNLDRWIHRHPLRSAFLIALLVSGGPGLLMLAAMALIEVYERLRRR